MANPWLLALKVIPWSDVIEHAPKVLSAARKLLDKQAPPPTQPVTPPIDTLNEAPPSLGELKNRLIAAQVQIDQQAQTQQQLTQTLAELAEQQARLVDAVETLRLRSRWLMRFGAALLLWVLWLSLAGAGLI